MTRLKNIVNNRPVAILAHGSSIEELEKRIEEFADYNICWTSLNYFTLMEDFILSKINKKLDIIYDSSTIADSLREEFDRVRIDRITNFLKRPDNNIWITTFGIVRDVLKPHYGVFLSRFFNKIFLVDNLFPRNRIGYYMGVPGSITLLIATMLASGAKRIILFGFDGYIGNVRNGINSYYQPELQEQERIRALGHNIDSGINRDTYNFENKFIRFLKDYRILFHNNAEIINCSPNSFYTIFKKVNYNEVKKWLI